MGRTAVREPNFDPWNSSVFQVVKPAFRERDVSSGLRSRSRVEDVNVRALEGSRYYTNMSTQTDQDFGLPRLNKMTSSEDYDDLPQYRGGSQTARPFSGSGQNVPHNNFYQRLRGYRPEGEPLTARMAKEDYPTISVDAGGFKRKMYQDPGPPVFRSGRAGASWRHVRQCTGNLGNHICFIDGAVKESDMTNYPPYGYIQPTESAHTYISPRLTPSVHRQNDGQNTDKYANVYSNRAKKGYKYWQQERPLGVVTSSQDRMALWSGSWAGRPTGY